MAAPIPYERIDKVNNILYGGPIPVNYADGTKSMGELIAKKLTETGNYVVLVCVHLNVIKLIANKLIIV